MNELYQVVRYNRVLFEGKEHECRFWIYNKGSDFDISIIQVWKKSIREGINKGWV